MLRLFAIFVIGCLLLLSSCSRKGQFPAHKYIMTTPNLWDKILYAYPKHLGYFVGQHDTLIFNPDYSIEIINHHREHHFAKWEYIDKNHIKLILPLKTDTFIQTSFWRGRRNNMYHMAYWMACGGDTTKHYALKKFKPLKE